ncbi:MAG TPA: LD-carboxypeptidase [Candidatus Acidoferrales bacterium]|jgi:muramoyltetrapeptide carboxypeptidase|nr:LD-carboxypeptidase [Candidatus Acidoferrales bacterium]
MPQTLKPRALRHGDEIRVLSLASPVQEDHLEAGCRELARLGYVPKIDRGRALARESFFAGSAPERLAGLKEAFADPAARAVFCSRGGYGSNYLLDGLSVALAAPKIFLGSSDLTSLQIFLWQKFRWITFYGPMVASNFDRGSGAPHGYDCPSLMSALTETRQSWSIELRASSMVSGQVEGTLLGGCLTLVETALGTPWELETKAAILLLEDRGMKPYQVDRALMHLKQAGKFRGVAGIILGDFPDCAPPEGGETVESVATRILAPLGVPIVWGAPIGHTSRSTLTVPLGVRVELSSAGSGALKILEPACIP